MLRTVVINFELWSKSLHLRAYKINVIDRRHFLSPGGANQALWNVNRLMLLSELPLRALLQLLKSFRSPLRTEIGQCLSMSSDQWCREAIVVRRCDLCWRLEAILLNWLSTLGLCLHDLIHLHLQRIDDVFALQAVWLGDDSLYAAAWIAADSFFAAAASLGNRSGRPFRTDVGLKMDSNKWSNFSEELRSLLKVGDDFTESTTDRLSIGVVSPWFDWFIRNRSRPWTRLFGFRDFGRDLGF